MQWFVEQVITNKDWCFLLGKVVVNIIEERFQRDFTCIKVLVSKKYITKANIAQYYDFS